MITSGILRVQEALLRRAIGSHFAGPAEVAAEPSPDGATQVEQMLDCGCWRKFLARQLRLTGLCACRSCPCRSLAACWGQISGPCWCNADVARYSALQQFQGMYPPLCTSKLSPAAQAALVDGRAIARILHAVNSPMFPASEWAKSPWWGRHAGVDFDVVLQAADRVVGQL